MSESWALLAQEQEQEQKKPWGYEVEVDFPLAMASALSSNASPPEDAIRVARAFREEPAQALAAIEDKLSTIDTEIERLKKQKETLVKEAGPHFAKLKACDAILAPIRRVPYDVLREITLYSMPLHPSPKLNDVPLSVAHVCSAWRATVLSSPQLWTTLFIRIDNIDQFPRYKILVQEWFKRAKGLPLSFFIYFDCEPLEDSEETQDFRNFLASFAPFVPQVCHLGIGASWVGNILPLFVDMDPEWDLRNLERLDFLSPGADFYNQEVYDGLEPALIPPVTIFNRAPLLRRFTIFHEFMENRGVRGVLPWAQLTHVQLSSEGIAIETWIAVLELCPQMQIGHFLIRDWEVDESFKQDPIRSHSQLQYLSLEIMYPHPHFLDLLKVFDLPNLRRLELHCGEDEMTPTEDLPSPKGLKQLSSLRSLVLLFWSYPLDYLIAILQEAINVEELVLRSDPRFTPVIHSLIYTPSTILPQLSVLKLFLHPSTDMNTFVSMIKSRSVDVPSTLQPLQRLFIEICVSPSMVTPQSVAELEELLRPCIEKGLFLNIDVIFTGRSKLKDRIEPFDGWRL